jgi:hypothetical protein
MEMIRQCLDVLHQATSEPLAGDSPRATHTAPCHPLHQQAFNQRSGVISEERWRTACAKLAPTVLASLVLCAVVKVTILLICGRLPPWTHVSDDPGVLVTSTLLVDVCSRQ